MASRVTSVLTLVLIAAFARFGAMGLFDAATGADDPGSWARLLYLPAGVNVIATLAGGAAGIAGVGLGSLLWFLVDQELGAARSIATASIPPLACIIALLVMRAWRNGQGRSYGLRLKDVVIFCLIYSLCNGGLRYLILPALFSDTDRWLHSLAVLMLGDLAGSLVLFLLLNVGTSAWLGYRRAAALR